jgi:hypothetical protein
LVLVEISCSPKSLVWMKRPGSRDGKNSPGSFRSDRSSESDCLVQVGHAPKKRPSLIAPWKPWYSQKRRVIPTVEQKWVRINLRHLSQRLEEVRHPASPPTIGRLLRKLGYSLRVNVKKREASVAHPDRQHQFELLESQRHVFQAAGWPIISVDTKKKELIGNAQKRRASLGSRSRGGQCA